MPLDAKKKLLSATSSITAQCSVDSVLELKKLTKMVPLKHYFYASGLHQWLEGGLHTPRQSLTGPEGGQFSPNHRSLPADTHFIKILAGSRCIHEENVSN